MKRGNDAEVLRRYQTCEALARYMGRENPNGKEIAVALYKMEQEAHDAATAQCNGEPYNGQPYRDEDAWQVFKRETAIALRRVLCLSERIMVPGFFINGDPRGYALKIDNENSGGKKLIDAVKLHTDWGGYGILSPEIEGGLSTLLNEPTLETPASRFLKDNEITMRITLSDSKPAPWDIAGHHYRVTLSRPPANKTGHDYKLPTRLAFDFWDSASNMTLNKKPTEADILETITSEITAPETFAEYCSEFGKDADSIKAKQTYARLDRFAKRLKAFFTAEERDMLGELAR